MTTFETLVFAVLCLMEANMIVLSVVVLRTERKIDEREEG